MENPVFEIDYFSDKASTMLIYGQIVWSRKP
jgi:hypothetical protein